MRLPSLARLSQSDIATKRQRVFEYADLFVVESACVNEYNPATVSVAEMVVARHIYQTLSAHRGVVIEEPYGEGRTMLRTIKNAANVYGSLLDVDKKVIPVARQVEMKDDVERWQRIYELPLQKKLDDITDDDRLRCDNYLDVYLRERRVAFHTEMFRDATTRDGVCMEYFGSGPQMHVLYPSPVWTHTLRVYERNMTGCVGIVRFNDSGHINARGSHYTMLDGTPVTAKCWYMQGIVSCPFFRKVRGGGVGRAILQHIKERIDKVEGNAVVCVDPIGSHAWRAKLAASRFVGLSQSLRDANKSYLDGTYREESDEDGRP